MALPICSLCCCRTLLCRGCDSLLKQGKITACDVEVSRILFGLMGEEADFSCAISVGDQVMVLTKSSQVGSVIGRAGVNLRAIQDALGRPVKVVGEGDAEELARAFTAPAKLLKVNKVYVSGGEKIRVHVQKGDEGLLRLEADDVVRLLGAASGCDVELVFG